MFPVALQENFRRAGPDVVSSKRAWREPNTSGVVVASHPDDARGLEFDGVVVVEPADIPRNNDPFGSLYTSLTRATNELIVVHSRDLPGRLGTSKR